MSAAIELTEAESRSATRRGLGRSTRTSATTGRAAVRTTTRSARKTASGIEWVTSRIVVPVRCQTSEQHGVEPLAGQRVEGAERLVEEQRPRARGRAHGRSTTRCRVPPDSGGRLRAARAPRARPGGAGRSHALPRGVPRPARELEREATFAVDGPPGKKPRLLEHETHAGPGPRTCAPRSRRSRVPAWRSPAKTRSSVLLPVPLGPMTATNSPRRDLERDAVEGGDRRAPRNVKPDVVEPRWPAAGRAQARAGGRGRIQPARPSAVCVELAPCTVATGQRDARPRPAPHVP